jgi:predicted DNA-binding transcriptional regulator YafY
MRLWEKWRHFRLRRCERITFGQGQPRMGEAGARASTDFHRLPVWDGDVFCKNGALRTDERAALARRLENPFREIGKEQPKLG